MRRRSKGEGGDGDEILGFLGEGTTLEGDLHVQGGLRVDGKIRGRIHSPSTLVVGATGEIEAPELRVRVLSVSGHVRGTLYVDERLEIQPTGRVTGKVVMRKRALTVEPGGQFEGTVEMPEGEPVSA